MSSEASDGRGRFPRPLGPPAADLREAVALTASVKGCKMQDRSHRQDPLLQIVQEDRFDNVRDREAQAMNGAAHDLRSWALTLPPDSEIRALLLRSAGRYVAASAGELGPHLRLAVPS